MKIYFSGAISQIESFGEYYKRIVTVLQTSGNKVQFDHIINQSSKDIFSESDEEKISYYRKFLKWLSEADLMVVEASFPSTVHIGHEISIALEKGIPVVVLFKKGRNPVFLEGIMSDKLLLQEYTNVDLETVLMDAVGYASDQQDTRFNFFISPKQQNYLDWVTKHKKIPRAVFLRRLIEDDMENNPDFS